MEMRSIATGGCRGRGWQWGLVRVVLGSLIVMSTNLGAETRGASPDLSGRWRGRWESVTTGHQGPISARFRPIDGSEYRVVFRGRFLKVIPFRYGINMQVQSNDGETMTFEGQKSLGRIFGGEFRYQAEVSGNEFRATYESRKDHGTFEMTRQ